MVLRVLLLSVMLLPISLHASAEDVLELYMPDAPPLTFTGYQGGYGMVGDVALAAISRAGYLSRLPLKPWPRAQQHVSRGHNMLIAPMPRTPERAELFTWIAPIMLIERAFFSLDTPVANFVEARERYRRVAVGHGTAQQEVLKQQGFSDEQIVSLKLGDSPPRMLELGRIDAWFTSVPEGLYQWSGSPNKLKMGPVLSSEQLYLACSKHCDTVIVEQLRQSVTDLQRKGVVKTLQDAYLQQR